MPTVFRGVTPCSLVEDYRGFRGTSANVYHIAQRHVPEYGTFELNLKI